MKSGTEVTFLIEFAKIIIASKGPGGYYLGAENYMCKGLAKQQGLNPPPTPPSPSTRSLHVRLQAYSLLSLAYMGGGAYYATHFICLDKMCNSAWKY